MYNLHIHPTSEGGPLFMSGFQSFFGDLSADTAEGLGCHLEEGGHIVKRGAADDFGVFTHGADVAFLGGLEAEGVGFLLGNDEGTLVELEDELADLEGVAGNGMEFVVGNAIDDAGLDGGGNNFGGLAQEIALNADDHVAFVTDMFGDGGAVFGVVLQHHTLLYVKHVVADFSLADEVMSAQHFEGNQDFGEGVQGLHAEGGVVASANVPCHFASSVVQVHVVVKFKV